MMLTYFSSFILIFGGGFSWFFVGEHSKHVMPFEFSIFYRQALAGIFLAAIAIIKRASFKLTKEQVKLCAVITIFYYIIYYFGAYKASSYLIPGIVSFVSSTKVLFAESILAIREKRRPSGRIIIASIFGIIGLSIMSKANMNVSNLNIYDLLFGLSVAFLAPIGNSISSVMMEVKKDVRKNLDNFVIASYCWLFSALFFLIIGMLKYKHLPPIPLEKSYLVPLFYLSFVSSGITMVCTYHLIDKIGAVQTTYMSLLHAPFAILLSVLFRNYPVTAQTAAGLSLCLFSIYISNTYSLKKTRYMKISQERKNRYKAK